MNNSPQQFLPSHYLVNLLDYVKAEGISVSKLLKKSELTSEVINDPDGELSLQQFADMFKYSVQLSQQPALGLFLGCKLGITAHGILGYAVMTSTTLEQALNLVVKYFRTRTPLASLKLLINKQQVSLQLKELNQLPNIQHTYIETVLGTLTKLLIFLTQSESPLLRINVNYPAPEYHFLYQEMLGCPIHFNASNISLHFKSKLLNQPLPHADKTANLIAVGECDKVLNDLLFKQSYSSKIERKLLKSKHHFADFEEMAKRLYITRRTLRRRLAEEGTSFKQILDKVKFILAKNYLKTSRYSIHEISYLLGYSDPSNFGRAFKKWSGKSPIEFRG